MPPIVIDRHYSAPTSEDFSKLKDLAIKKQVVIIVVIGMKTVLDKDIVFEFSKRPPGVYVY